MVVWMGRGGVGGVEMEGRWLVVVVVVLGYN